MNNYLERNTVSSQNLRTKLGSIRFDQAFEHPLNSTTWIAIAMRAIVQERLTALAALSFFNDTLLKLTGAVHQAFHHDSRRPTPPH